jgi:hypothetical protein
MVITPAFGSLNGEPDDNAVCAFLVVECVVAAGCSYCFVGLGLAPVEAAGLAWFAAIARRDGLLQVLRSIVRLRVILPELSNLILDEACYIL